VIQKWFFADAGFLLFEGQTPELPENPQTL